MLKPGANTVVRRLFNLFYLFLEATDVELYVRT
jgi:hypothetical protein